MGESSYWLTRVVLLRCLAALYGVAFLVAVNQNGPLIGEEGLTPATLFVKNSRGGRGNLELITTHPTLFWIIPPTTTNLSLCANLGFLVALYICVRGAANVPLLFFLWAAYFSIVSVGQTWYSFGWESQVLESGFLAMFMVPLFSVERYPAYTPTPSVCLWGYRWLLFRIMIGAGMIKIRGDQCWRDLTCMNYHYQTQPNPNPLSIYFHNNPEVIHMMETLGNHFVELVCPFLVLVPLRWPSIVGAVIQIAFQAILISSGNLSFLNWLTALPAVVCFDDQFLAGFFTEDEVGRAAGADLHYKRELYRYASNNRFFTVTPAMASILNKEKDDEDDPSAPPSTSAKGLTLTQALVNHVLLHCMYARTWAAACIASRRLTGLLLAVLLAILSYPVVNNILSPNQAMNTNFEPFRIVNTYGAFGSITKVRHEVILLGTSDAALGPNTQWREFDFPCKPGNIDRAPCLISPYHLRMDWLLWFAAFQSYQHCPWLVAWTDQVLSGRESAVALLADGGNPFAVEREICVGSCGRFNVSSVLDGCCSGNDGTMAEDKKAKRGKKVSTYKAPKFIRAELYEYEYSALNEEQREKDRRAGWEVGRWWKRRHARNYMPAIEKGNESVKQFLRAYRLIE